MSNQHGTTVRIDGRLKGPLKREAGQDGVSVRRWVNEVLDLKITGRQTRDQVAMHVERALEALASLPALPGMDEVDPLGRKLIETTARRGIHGELSRTLAVWKEKPWTRWAEDDTPTDLPPADGLPPLPADKCPPGYAEPEKKATP